MNNALNSTYVAVGIGALIVALVAIAGLLARRSKPMLDTLQYQERWRAIQKLLKDSATWPLAVIDADKLLDQALKDKGYRGKTTGERLVAAQRDIQGNDEVWFGHKLRNKLVHETDVKLKEREVKDALLGIRRALKDLGAL